MRARVGAAHAGRVLGSRLCDRRLHRAGRRRPGLLCGVARLLRRRRRRGPRALGGLAHCWFGFLGGVFHRRDRLVGDVLEHRRRLVGKLAQRRAHAVGERLNGVGRLVNGDLRVCQRICVRGSYAASWMALLALPTPYPTAYAALDAACLSLSEMPTMLPPCRQCAVGVCSRYPLEVYMPSGQRPGAPVHHVRTVSKHINRFNGDSAPLSARRPRPDSTTQLRVIQLKTILFEM